MPTSIELTFKAILIVIRVALGLWDEISDVKLLN
jgi:hypothetical protein